MSWLCICQLVLDFLCPLTTKKMYKCSFNMDRSTSDLRSVGQVTHCKNNHIANKSNMLHYPLLLLLSVSSVKVSFYTTHNPPHPHTASFCVHE